MMKVTHPCIIKMKEIIRENEECNLIFEYIESNLLDFYQNNILNERDIKIIIYQCI
jgi:serine/threonine protein kinase